MLVFGFFIFSDFILKFCLHDKISKNVIYTICIALPFISMSSAISGYFVAVRRVYKSTIAQFFEQIIKIIVTALFLNLFLPKGLEIACFTLVLGDLISEILSFILNYILYLHDSKKYKTSYITHHTFKYYVKKILKLSTPVATASFIRSGLSTIKQIIIPISFEKGILDCSQSLRLYGEINGMALPIVVFPNVIFSSISSLLVPEFSSYLVQNKKNLIKKLTKIILIISTIIAIIISFILLLFADKLGNFIYHDNTVSNYIKILAPISIFILLDCVIDNILKGLDAQVPVMLINVLDLFINIIFIYTLVPKFKIHGYILSMYFSEIFNLSLSIDVLYKKIK